MKHNNQLSLLVLVCINMMDSIMGAIVGPTLIFYVTELGGGKIEYGVMNSIASVGSLLMISVYGTWVDTNGNKFVVPYMTSFAGGIVGNLIYFLAILLPKGPIALYTLIFSRLIVGMSSAGRNLSYIWVASAIPRDNQRTIFTFLTMTKIGGMIVGPLSNLLVSEIDTEFTVFGLRIPVNPNNSIGLMMVVGEIILVIITLLFFKDPPEKKQKEKNTSAGAGAAASADVDTTTKSEAKGFWYAIGHFNIFFPVFTGFCVSSCFQLAFIALSPVAKNVGWNTVRISEVSSLGSATMAGSLFLSGIVSMHNVSDLAMISFGMIGFGVGGVLMYVWWEGTDIGYLHLALPLCLDMFSYPFIGPANRSIFTKAIHDNPELEGCHGMLMGLINQAGALSGIIAPTLISLFVLRNQEEIDATPDNQHQVTLGVMYAPLFALLVLLGLMYQYIKTKNDDNTSDTTDGVSDESTTLLLSNDGDSSKKKKSLPRASIVEISDNFSIQSEANRRMSVECMGIPNPVETKYEQEFAEKLKQDRKSWEELQQLDAVED